MTNQPPIMTAQQLADFGAWLVEIGRGHLPILLDRRGVQYLQPVFGIGASAFLFGDKLGLVFAAGVGLVLAGLGLAAAGKRRGS